MKKLYVFILLFAASLQSWAVIHTITVQNFVFTPSTLTANCNDTIRFTWISGSHPVASETGAWTTFTMSTTLTQKDIVLSTAGTYAYYCMLHGGPGGVGMSGTITVNCAPPPCGVPTGIASSMITASTAKISWTAVAGASKYQIQYRPMGTMTWTKVSVMNITKKLTGLTTATVYQYKVKTICPSGSSAFSPIHTFTTLTPRLPGNEMSMGLFPNPSHGEFQLVLDDLQEGNIVIEITNLTGQNIYSETISNTSDSMIKYITLPSSFTGMACVRVSNGDKVGSRIVMIQ